MGVLVKLWVDVNALLTGGTPHPIRSDVCKDRLDCQKAHSEDEFVEWGNRYQHRKRKTAGEQNPLNIVPQGVGVVLPANVRVLTFGCCYISPHPFVHREIWNMV